MKNRILFKFLFAIVLIPFLSHSQESTKGFNRFEESENEKPDELYLPNAYDNKKLSPANRYVIGNSITTGELQTNGSKDMAALLTTRETLQK